MKPVSFCGSLVFTLLFSCFLDGLYEEAAKALVRQHGPKDLTGFCHVSFLSPATH